MSDMVRLEGVPELKRVFAEIEHELSAREMLSIQRGAGSVVVKASRSYVSLTGELKRATKRDIGIVKSRIVKGQAETHVGLRFRDYEINGKMQKIAPIVRHFTQGFRQSNRTGAKSGGKGRRNRGKVRVRTQDFIEQAFNATQAEQVSAINGKVFQKLNKIKAKHGL